MRAARATLATVFLLAAALAAPPAYRYQRLGHPNNIRTATHPGFALIGGGTDLDEAFQWMCQRSGRGDFLVLRASGTDAYNPYIQKLCPAENSVATLIIPSRAAAQDPFVASAIRAAAAIFISGGDQSNYVNFWTGTPVQAEINAAVRRGVPIGGTSAGLAVLPEFAYSAQADKPDGPDLTSAAALANPFHPQVVIARHFLAIPALRGVITDTHFANRNRLGRLLVFMARILQDGQARTAHGLGVDQHTAVLLDPDGQARVAGTGHAYFLSATAKPALCRPGQPLTFGPIAVRRLAANDTFNLKTWTAGGSAATYTLTVRQGQLASTQPQSAIY